MGFSSVSFCAWTLLGQSIQRSRKKAVTHCWYSATQHRMRGKNPTFSDSLRSRKQKLVALGHHPGLHIKQAQRVPEQRALSLTGKQKVKHPRGTYSDWWSVCYSSFVPTAALGFTLSKAHAFWRRDRIFKSPEVRWNRFGRSEGRHTVGGAENTGTWGYWVKTVPQCW